MCGLRVCKGTMVTGLSVLAIVICLVSCSSATLSFRSEPQSAVQHPGGAVHLRCSARPPTARLSWRFNGKPLNQSSVPGLRLRSGSLTLPSLEPSHAGLYQCVARSDAGAIASRLARVAVAGISEFAETSRRTLTVAEGTTAHIMCPMPHSDPPALPRLRVRGQWLTQSSDEYLILPSGSLQIKSASAQHQGTYRCAAYNPVTQETRLEAHGTKLLIKPVDDRSSVRIVFPITPQAVSVVQSESVTLECVLSGNLSLSARWTKDGKEVLGGAGHGLLHNNLVLTSARSSDAGNYQCLFQTEKEMLVSANYTLSVLEPASVLRGFTDQSVSSGSAVRFVCLAKGHPAPNVTWLFNSNPITPSARIQISGSALRVAAVTSQDQGMYQCLLDNGIGSAQSFGALTVLFGPGSKPIILSPPLSGTFQEGNDVLLSCNASGHPLPVIRWYNSDGPIATHPTRLLQPLQTSAWDHGDSHTHLTMARPGSSSLYIQAVTAAHAGKYICEASNRLGSAQAEAFLTVDALQSTMTSMVTESSRFLDAEQRDEGEEPFSAKERPGHGQAVPTDRAGDTPTPEAPIITSPPQTHKPDTYDLEWRPGRDWGSPINAYFVKYRKLDEAGSVVGGWHTVRVPGSEKTLRLSELEASSLYEVLMVARSDAGDGQPAMLTFRTGRERTVSSAKKPPKTPVVYEPEETPKHDSSRTHFGVVLPDRVPEAPDRPTISMATENSVYVTWIPRANGGSPITAFRVEYRRQGRSTDWVTAADNISPLKLSVEVRDLEPGSTYRFRVIAINIYGESPHSSSSRQYQVSAVSPPLSKRPVTGPHISSTDAVSDTQIMLRWTYTPSSNNNTPIQGFYIYYRPTDSDNDGDYKRDTVKGLKQWHLIGQLQPETSYDIKMQCFNEGGESEYSNVMICETKARPAPGAAPVLPVTPPGRYAPDPQTSAGGLLYLIVGCVLGVMVLILLIFIAMCLWRNRQQNGMQKFDPPGYLYQPAEMNGHVLDYATLPSGHMNGSAHGGYGHHGHALSPGCPHLHHKLPNGLALLNGTATFCTQAHPHPHKSPLPHGTLEYGHSPASHPHLDGGLYTALPQSDPSDCISCQNFCNNNRCYSKTNGSLVNGSPSMTLLGGSCQQEVLEMTSLGRVTQACSGATEPCRPGDESAVSGEDSEQDGTLSSAQPSCCEDTDYQHYLSEHAGVELQSEDLEGRGLCWDTLDLPELDCHEEATWMAPASHGGHAVQPVLQEA